MSFIINPYQFGGAFSPDDISGLYLWLKADAITGLSNNDPVGTWIDSSAAGDDATQATSAEKPTYKTNTLNGLPVVSFDGGDALDSPASAAQKPFSHFAVVRVTDFDNYRQIMNASGAGINWRANITTGYPNLDKQGSVNIGTASSGPSANTWAIWTITYSGSGDWVWYLDGSSVGSGTADVTFNASTIRIGADPGYSYPFLGDLAEILCYDTVLSTGDRGDVTAHLQSKYAL